LRTALSGGTNAVVVAFEGIVEQRVLLTHSPESRWVIELVLGHWGGILSISSM